MRQYIRPQLNSKSQKSFDKWTIKIQAHTKPQKEASRLWRQARKTKSVRNAEKQLRVMNGNRRHCMYCEHDEGTNIDHWKPIAKESNGAFNWDNMFLSCSRCNTMLKADKFPLDTKGDPLLINLVMDDPIKNIVFTPSTGSLYSNIGNSKGQVTVELFRLSDFDKPRKERYHQICIYLRDMEKHAQPCCCKKRNSCTKCKMAKDEIFHPEMDFHSLLSYIVHIGTGPNAVHLLGQDIVDVIIKYNVKDWL